jgi:phospholipid/cholesterol/gamma-HCH transport system substrate-binding protein
VRSSRSRHPVRSLVAVLVLALATSGCGAFGGRGDYTLTAELTRSFNLFPGSPVRVLGVDVGQITDIEVPEGARTVQVHMRIEGDVDVPADSTATVVPASLLGERFVQLSPYTAGPTIEDGATIPVDRTQVPFEFDEVLGSLEDFVGGLDGPEVGRFVDNLAATLEGQGAQLGSTIDQASEAIGVLRDNDDELVALASRLADLNETLSSRDQEIATLLQDFDTLASSLVDDRGDIDAALSGLVRVTDQLTGLLEANRERLEDDIEVLTRVGRTADRNLDNVSLAVLGSAELFRHAERVIDRERAFLPLQSQAFALGNALTEGIVFRIQGLCLQAGLEDTDLCQIELIEELLGGTVCATPIFPCPEDGSATPIEEALANLVAAEPELGEAVLEQLAPDADPPPEDDASSEASDDGAAPTDDTADEDDGDDDGGLLDGVGGLLGGGR